MLLAAEARDRVVAELVVVGAVLLIMALQLCLLFVAGKLNTFLGVTGQHVISRTVGILLAALAFQFVATAYATAICSCEHERERCSASPCSAFRCSCCRLRHAEFALAAGKRIRSGVATYFAERRVAMDPDRGRDLVLDAVR